MQITGYRFGRMEVDGRPFDRDLILDGDEIRVEAWWRKQGHRLDIADLEALFEHPPEVLVVGTGAHGCVEVPEETRRAAEARGIEIRAAPTPRAVTLFNDLADGKRVAGAFHLTC